MSERKLVFIASPFAGDIKHNTEMAIRYCRYALEQGCDFIAPHLIYPRVLNDRDPAERQRGIQMGLRLLSKCDELCVCGDRITEGMKTEIAEAKRLEIRIVRVCLDEEQNIVPEQWGVWARRGPTSIFGPAEAWVKSEGKIITFDSYEKAAQKADAFTKNVGSANVTYYPKKIGPDQKQLPSSGMNFGL